jgi:hypothetical protein
MIIPAVLGQPRIYQSDWVGKIHSAYLLPVWYTRVKFQFLLWSGTRISNAQKFSFGPAPSGQRMRAALKLFLRMLFML